MLMTQLSHPPALQPQSPGFQPHAYLSPSFTLSPDSDLLASSTPLSFPQKPPPLIKTLPLCLLPPYLPPSPQPSPPLKPPNTQNHLLTQCLPSHLGVNPSRGLDSVLASACTTRYPTRSPKSTTLFTLGISEARSTSWKIWNASTPVKVRWMGEAEPGREV